MTKKDLFLSVMRNEKPTKWMGSGFDAYPDGAAEFGPGGPERLFHAVIDPITNWDILQFSGERYQDLWGVTHRYILGVDPGIIPMVDDNNKVIKDITKWRDYVKFPKIPDNLDWSAAQKHAKAASDRGELVMVPSFRGLFERLHCLETFEDVLVDMYEEPESCDEFFSAYADWKIEVFKQIIDNVKPDIIHSHDDLGSLNSMFFSVAKFEELLKPHYKRMYDYVHDRGVMVQHHCDCYVEPIVMTFFADLGVEMWQGALPTNDIVKLQKQLDERGSNLLMMGGIDQTIVDRDDVTDDEIRTEIRRAIDAYAPGGHFVPCIGSIQCLHEHATEVCEDEMNKYGAEWVKKNS